jgi:signal transduction histidine kinase/DNA-binding response OmpR family regulator
MKSIDKDYGVQHKYCWLFAILVVLSLSPACSPEPDPKKFLIGFSQCCDDPWRDVMNREMFRELAFHPELNFEMRIANNDSKMQVTQIRELVASGIDLLIVAPNESKPLTEVIEEVYKKGIPVILIDRRTESDQYTAYIGADNYEIGRTAAKYIANALGGKGNVIELQLMLTISPAFERNRGFQDALQEIPGMRVVDKYEIIKPLEEEEQNIIQLFKDHPEVTVVFGHTDLLAETAWKVCKDLGREKDIFFVGIDGIPGTGQGIQAVENGVLNASLLYPTGGSEAIKLALSVLNRLPFEKTNWLQTTVINPGNAAILHSQMKKEASLQESIDKQIKAQKELNSIYRNQRTYIFFLISSLLLSLFLGAFLLHSLRSKQAINKNLEIKTREALEHEEQIVTMSEELKQATQEKVDFFTNISHEFRTPLTLILGFAEDIIPSAKMSKDVQQSIDFIRQNAYRLLRLVNQLMDFRKIESDRMRLRASEHELTDFVRVAMRSFGRVAEKRGIDFQLVVRKEQVMLWFDPAMLDKVLFNLLSNAFKFTPDRGKITLSISVDTFENRVIISVEDSGIGMTTAELDHVFEVFYQGEGVQKGGSGLGLSLSKALVELNGGNLTVSSIQGKGSRFSITLPTGNEHIREDQKTVDPIPYFHTEEFFPNMNLESEEAGIVPIKTADQQILIIEDNAELQFFLKRKLSGIFQTTAATHGNAGLQHAFDTIPDLIICDIGLPDRDGLEIVRMLKSDLRTSHIPIILLTARNTIEQQVEGVKSGADSYVTKPFHIQFLREKIRNLLHNRQILKESYSKDLVLYSGTTDQELSAAKINPIDHAFGLKFTKYLETHYARQDFQVTDLCLEMQLSRSQLYRKVKALYGESISDYIQHVRLEKARVLLLEGTQSVADIAYQVGYSSPDYFSTVFKSKYSIAPSQLRKQV